MDITFSIITPTFNAADTIKRTIDSIDCQTFNGYEHLIVDGASSDHTLSIVKSSSNPNRRCISEPDNGLYDAMNKGINSTTGHYLIFLNAGDKFHSKNTLQRIANTITATDYPDIVYGQTVIVDNNGLNPRPRHLTAPRKLTLKSFAQGMLVCHQAFIAKRNICDYYNTKYRFSADYDWCICCLQKSKNNVIVNGEEPLIDYLDEGLTTKNHKKSLKERFTIMCQNYGYVPTTLRHIGFAYRALKRKIFK